MTFGDAVRSRACRVTELPVELEMTPEFSTGQEQLDAKVHLMR